MIYYPQVYRGKSRCYPHHEPSAIAKSAVNDRLRLTKMGLIEDEQAEAKVHGGSDRALCHYPQEHYHYWQTCYPEKQALLHPAAVGENISTQGLTEQHVFIGDIYSWGDALIQVTEPRLPCYKLNDHLDIADLSLQMQNSGRCGWLYRVIREGEVGSALPLQCINRITDVSIADVLTVLFHMPFAASEYQRILRCAALSASLVKLLQQRLLTNTIEVMTPRLTGVI